MNTLLKKRTAKFLEICGMPKTLFAKKVELSVMSLNLWLNDTRELSPKTEERIDQFMTDHVSRLTEIIK